MSVYDDINNFLTKTSLGKGIDFVTDFIPGVGTVKNLGLGAISAFDNSEGTDWGRIAGGISGAISPLLAKGAGKYLANKGAKLAANAGAKQAAKLAGGSVDDIVKASSKALVTPVATKGSNVLNTFGKLANSAGSKAGGAVATGLGTQVGKNTTTSTIEDIQNQAQANELINSDLLTGNYFNSLINQLNNETINEYNTYANDLAKKQTQDETNAGYSAMNAGNVGLATLLSGNVANTYNQLNLEAQKALSQQKTGNTLKAKEQESSQLQNLLSVAQQLGDENLYNTILKRLAGSISTTA